MNPIGGARGGGAAKEHVLQLAEEREHLELGYEVDLVVRVPGVARNRHLGMNARLVQQDARPIRAAREASELCLRAARAKRYGAPAVDPREIGEVGVDDATVSRETKRS